MSEGNVYKQAMSLAVLLMLSSTCGDATGPVPAEIRPFLGRWHLSSDPITTGVNIGWYFRANLTMAYSQPTTLVESNILVTGPMEFCQVGNTPECGPVFQFSSAGTVYPQLGLFAPMDVGANRMWITGTVQNEMLQGEFLYINGQNDPPDGMYVGVRAP